MKKQMTKFLAVVSLAALPMMGAHAGAGNHHAALFMGATNPETGSTNYPTLGIEYEYRTPLWDRKIGIGIVAERIFKTKFPKRKADILVAGVVVHPWKGLKLNLSVGTEFIDSKNKDVVRVGAGYDFHYKNLSYGPIYNLDNVDGKNAHVYGLAVGFGF